MARKSPAKTQLPDNIKVISYPEIDLAQHYPAVGPAGISEMDINGLVCSIELYFGTEVLTQDGQLTPIQWKGYDESVKQYQGEVLNKKILQEAFMKKAHHCIVNHDILNTTDWNGMRLIWEHIFQCFV